MAGLLVLAAACLTQPNISTAGIDTTKAKPGIAQRCVPG